MIVAFLLGSVCGVVAVCVVLLVAMYRLDRGMW